MTLSKAVITEEERPKGAESITLDMSHTQHTTAQDGSFKHPFHDSDSNITSIYYKKSKTISKKLSRVQ